MVIEAKEVTLGEDGKRLITINYARREVLDLGICAKEDVDQKIRESRELNKFIVPNDVWAAVLLIDEVVSVNPQVRKNYEERYGPYSITSLRQKVFGGLEIDPENANLPKIK